MQKNKINILSTGLLGTQLIDEAETQNVIIDERSFIETKLIGDEKTSAAIQNCATQNITAIFTSMNAVDAVVKQLDHPPKWKIYCIGNTTKIRVVDFFGEHAVSGTASNAEELGQVIVNDKIMHLVFFCGDHRRNELPEKLKQHGVAVDEVVVYQTVETPVLIDNSYDGILFFSPSAVQSFFSVNKIDTATELFAIGSTTAKAIQQCNKNNVVISGSPDKEAMVRQVVQYYKNGEE